MSAETRRGKEGGGLQRTQEGTIREKLEGSDLSKKRGEKKSFRPSQNEEKKKKEKKMASFVRRRKKR